MKYGKRALSLVLAVLFVLLLTGCPDLGSYENDEDYVNSFTISFIDGSNELISSYSMEDFYYPDLQYSIESPMEDPTAMKYLYIKPTRDLKIGELAFYLKSPKSGTLDINVYIMSVLPDRTKFRNVNDEFQKFMNSETIDQTGYSDPKEGAISKVGFTLMRDSWDSRLINIDKKVSKDQYLVFQFVQNTDAFYTVENESEESYQSLIENINENRVEVFLTAIFIRSVE